MGPHHGRKRARRLAVLQGMRAGHARGGGGSIINIASLAAVYGMPFGLHYATSKAAVIGMTRALARELGRDWIRVNAIAPSAVLTEGTDDFFGARRTGCCRPSPPARACRRTSPPMTWWAPCFTSPPTPAGSSPPDSDGGRRHGLSLEQLCN